jgi:hypothetical protein
VLAQLESAGVHWKIAAKMNVPTKQLVKVNVQ